MSATAGTTTPETELQTVAHSIVRRAHRQGFVVPREIREELRQGGVPEQSWREVLALVPNSLTYRRGRYYPLHAVSPRREQEQRQQRDIHRAVRRLIRAHKATAAQQERRQQGRIDFLQTVQVHTEDGRQLAQLSRDLSLTGIRLVGTRGLLGQKVRVVLPGAANGAPFTFLVRILWTCTVGDDLFENGGSFLELLPPEPTELKVVTQE
jgi:hypothetical protein